MRSGKKPLVEWKGGVHVGGTPLWCDASRSRQVCFLSCAAVPGARRHKQLIATDATLRLLPEEPGRGAAGQATLPAPYGRPFTLGTARLELYPSGHMVGAASLVVDVAGARVAYAGAVNPAGSRLSGPGEVRACDALVVDATFADTKLRFPPPAEVERELRAWVDQAVRDGGTPVLLVDPLRRAGEVLCALDGHALTAHRSIVDVARALRALKLPVPAVRRFGGTPPPGQVVLWPSSARDSRAVAAIRRLRIALVSGWAADPAVLVRVGAETGFAWTDRVDREGLLAYVSQTGAKELHFTGGGEELARRLGARILGPPRQLELF